MGRRSFPPRAWGCFRQRSMRGNETAAFPHGRGGVSQSKSPFIRDPQLSPRAWGCFWPKAHQPCNQWAFPTGVGVFLGKAPEGNPKGAFPTGVGVFLIAWCRFIALGSFPHGRGGVSGYRDQLHGHHRLSPRAWGCFRDKITIASVEGAFPTGVGVFLVGYTLILTQSSFPHGRGGVSRPTPIRISPAALSPRAWGVVSRTGSPSASVIWLSPRRGGVSTCSYHPFWEGRLSPTGVGVFPTQYRGTRLQRRFPHGLGDEPLEHVGVGVYRPRSPRTWEPPSDMRPAHSLKPASWSGISTKERRGSLNRRPLALGWTLKTRTS